LEIDARPRRIAIVGTGVAGLACAHALHRRHALEVFEAADRIGGHVHTVPVELEGRRFDVDTGFIVFNDRTYPGFCRLLDRLGVASRPTEMSFSVRCDEADLEYAGGGPSQLFADRRNLLRPRFLRMLRDVARFYRDARRLLAEPDPKVSLGAWLEGRGYGRELVEHHLLPMSAAIWSCAPEAVLEFPALTLARFFANHGLLDLRDRPQWRVVEGGSARYVEALVAPFRERIRLRCAVRSLRRLAHGVELALADGSCRRFDEVVLALHSDQALALLADPSPAERAVLGAIRYQRNDVLLHTDARVLPRRRRAWASWNYHVLPGARGRAAVTYHMNRLQRLDAPAELCVTLNAPELVEPARVLARFAYDHPVLDRGAVRAQEDWSAVSGVRRTHYCGAYWGYGFHEDGLQSALRVARAFGEEPA
jgi:predicted NAD/FAD-binding protein